MVTKIQIQIPSTHIKSQEWWPVPVTSAQERWVQRLEKIGSMLFFLGGGRHVILKDNTVLCSVCFFSTRPNQDRPYFCHLLSKSKNTKIILKHEMVTQWKLPNGNKIRSFWGFRVRLHENFIKLHEKFGLWINICFILYILCPRIT